MIYFITDGEYLKIGKATNLANRFQALQCASPKKLYIVATIDGIYKEESKLHKKFNNIRYNREWFYYTKELQDFIYNLESMDETVQYTICEINVFNKIDPEHKHSFIHRYEIDLIGSYIKFNENKTLLKFSLPFKFLNKKHYTVNY